LLWVHSERIRNEWSAIADVSTAHVVHISGARPTIIRGFEEIQKYLPRDENEDRELNHILRIFGTSEAVTTCTTVRACWKKADFTYQRRDGTFYLVVHEGKIGTPPDFQKIWERDYTIGSPSARPGSQKSGWLN
jgi:hypothetical protein